MRPRILVVDDDPELTELLKFNLERQGCDLSVAHGGIEGLRMARTEMPDLILLDLMLPDLEGLSVCEIFQARPTTRDIPVFIVSALDPSWVKTRRSKAKFAAYFRKPIELNLLKQSLMSVWAQQQALLRSKLNHNGD
jgi:CheY-like chemotaxis protein